MYNKYYAVYYQNLDAYICSSLTDSFAYISKLAGINMDALSVQSVVDAGYKIEAVGKTGDHVYRGQIL